MPEDNLWTLLRIEPKQVPQGKVSLIPALLDQRMTHSALNAEDATISIEPATESLTGIAAADMRMLNVVYKNYPRALHVFYTATFPYEIVGWQEKKPLKEGGTGSYPCHS